MTTETERYSTEQLLEARVIALEIDLRNALFEIAELKNAQARASQTPPNAQNQPDLSDQPLKGTPGA